MNFILLQYLKQILNNKFVSNITTEIILKCSENLLQHLFNFFEMQIIKNIYMVRLDIEQD